MSAYIKQSYKGSFFLCNFDLPTLVVVLGFTEFKHHSSDTHILINLAVNLRLTFSKILNS